MLALGATVEFTWLGDEVAADIDAAADEALAECARDAIDLIQIASPYLTGSLQSSVHAAPPGHSEDESPLYDRRIEGVWRPAVVPSVREIMAAIVDGAVWVGSWIRYAYYVDRGYYNVWAQRAIPGRNFIAPNAEGSLAAFPAFFRPAYERRAAERARGRAA